MSGIDEPTRTFECPDCGDVTYWVLEGQSVEDGDEELLGFLNNPDKNDDDPPLEIIKRFREMSLHTLLVHVHRFKCGDCGYNLTLNGLTWKKVSNRIKEVWKKRAYV